MTKREGILEAVVAALGTIPAVTIYRSRVNAFLKSESPAILVQWLSDTPDLSMNAVIDWSLAIRAAVLVRSTDNSVAVDKQADDLVAAVHSALLNDATLRTLTEDIQPSSADLQVIGADNDAGVVSSSFVFIYRTSLTDLTI